MNQHDIPIESFSPKVGLWILWWRQLPISYRLVETEDEIILKRTICNVMIHLLLKIVWLALVIYCWISLPFLWFFWILPTAMTLFRVIKLLRYQLVIDKQKKVLYYRELGTTRYPLGGAFYLHKSSMNDNMTARYDKKWLFELIHETEAFEKMIPYFESIDVPIYRSV